MTVLAALEVLVKERITGMPVIDDSDAVVSFSHGCLLRRALNCQARQVMMRDCAGWGRV